MRVYIYCSGDDVDEVLNVDLDQTVEENGSLGEARQPRRKLEDKHMKMRENVKSKLAKYLEPLFEATSAYKYYWWFSLMINPRYANELMDVRKLHEIETIETRTIINEIMPKFYGYIATTEFSENPYTAPPDVTKDNFYLYFDEETMGEPIIASRGGNILR